MSGNLLRSQSQRTTIELRNSWTFREINNIAACAISLSYVFCFYITIVLRLMQPWGEKLGSVWGERVGTEGSADMPQKEQGSLPIIISGINCH